MLNFKSDRLTYAELLAPPGAGFELTHAVGTSYSLDLFALLAIPVAMFYNRSLDGNYMQNRYDILDAIRKSKERVTIFCQRGKIHAPDSYSNLLAFVEDCIVEVLPENEFTSFHPKIWVLRFVNKRKICYRLAVLSRNLTFDRSWDIACFCEGSPQSSVTSGGKKLVNVLKHFYQLSGRMPDKKFLKELGCVEFDFPAQFDLSEIFPIVGGERASVFANPMINSVYEELLVVSPFVDDDAVLHFKSLNKKVTLLARGDELDKLMETSIDGITAYAFNHSIRDGELALDNEQQVTLYQDLHAKFYLGKNGGTTDWFIGSANCTAAAFRRNTEFLIKYSGRNPGADLDVIKNMLTDPQSRVFLPYERQLTDTEDAEKSLEHLLRRINYKLSATTFKGSVIERSEHVNFNLEVSADLRDLNINDDVRIYSSMLHRPEEAIELKAGQQIAVLFENVALTKLSHFLAIDIQVEKSSVCRLVVKLNIVNIPDERDDVIFNEMINSRQSFYRYLQFLLSPDELDGLSEIISDEGGSGSGNGTGGIQAEFSPPIYEHLLLAASRSPAKLREINQIMFRLERLNSEVIEDFKPVWEIFKKFADD